MRGKLLHGHVLYLAKMKLFAILTVEEAVLMDKNKGKPKNPVIGENWEDVRWELFTPEEIVQSDLRVALIEDLIKIRKESGINQKKLE